VEQIYFTLFINKILSKTISSEINCSASETEQFII
jgi:hypothetical protein